MDGDWKDIFPCWGEHSRMGHKVVYGRFTAGPGDSVICKIPALEGDDRREPTEAVTMVLPMAGPAFYGFRLMDEAAVMSLLLSRRPWREAAVLPQLEMRGGYGGGFSAVEEDDDSDGYGDGNEEGEDDDSQVNLFNADDDTDEGEDDGDEFSDDFFGGYDDDE